MIISLGIAFLKCWSLDKNKSTSFKRPEAMINASLARSFDQSTLSSDFLSLLKKEQLWLSLFSIALTRPTLLLKRNGFLLQNAVCQI